MPGRPADRADGIGFTTRAAERPKVAHDPIQEDKGVYFTPGGSRQSGHVAAGIDRRRVARSAAKGSERHGHVARRLCGERPTATPGEQRDQRKRHREPSRPSLFAHSCPPRSLPPRLIVHSPRRSILRQINAHSRALVSQFAQSANPAGHRSDGAGLPLNSIGRRHRGLADLTSVFRSPPA